IFPRMSEASGWIGFTNKLPDMTSEVYLLNPDGKKIKKIFEGFVLEGFSPNGKFLLYTTCDRDSSLYSYSLDSKRSTKLSDNLKVTAADWSPLGDWISVSALVEDGTNDLYLISTMAQGIVRLTQTDGINESFPQFTKDGKFLAFTSDRYGSNEIEFLDLENMRFQRPLIGGMYSALSPDSHWVVFESGNNLGISRVDGLYKREVVAGRTPFWIK
ncbi:PD40 domain-containing protein, partial [bacterium]|nr:PD40 domain-containing protein [bacterium]